MMRRTLVHRAALLALAGALSSACGGGGDVGEVGGVGGDGGDGGDGGEGGRGSGANVGGSGNAGGSENAGGGGAAGTGGSGGGGGEACQPGAKQACYTGPAGSSGIGACADGEATCNAAGNGWGPCEGEVLPSAETCATPGDDDCDGQANEDGAGCACVPGASVPCYTGPDGTNGMGLCASGTQQCNADGTGYGDCLDEVVPTAETCATPGDDDCDGQANESGIGCLCVPGTQAPCYTGPNGTQGVGACAGGQQTCNLLGTGYGACQGEVTPGVENCSTAADENCDGQTPACTGGEPLVDLRADVNRNGVVDLADQTEDLNEDTWSGDHGAIFLANLDDDQKSCPTSGQTDTQYAACNDAADSVINGPDDLLDLARLKSVPWPDAPPDAKATISVSAPGASNVRLFKNTGGSFTVFNPATDQISAAELQSGVELAIEGKNFVRDKAVWDGFVNVTLNVSGGTGPSGPLANGSDTVRLRVAPVIFRHHLDPAERVYASKVNNDTGSTAFRADLSAAITAAGVPNPLFEYTTGDQWNQDYFETAYMSMPGSGGAQKVVHVNFRSANYTNGSLRQAGRIIFALRGKDVAGAVQYDPAHPDGNDTLNSFGNLETIPPYTKNGTLLPLGKVLRGSTQMFYPDKSFDKMITSQSVQNILYVNTEWLLVGHVDETMSFIKASSPRGWVMLAADPTLAVQMLQAQKNAGNGGVPMFVGKTWAGGQNAQRTINQVLADPDVMNESAWAATKIDEQLAVVKAETGLTDQEIVPLATLFDQAEGYSIAYTPGVVNGIYLSDTDFGSPDPHGPTIGGQDIFKVQVEDALTPYGVAVHWIEDWDLYHRLDGEVHCGSNTTRAVPADIKWWESGL